MKTKFLLWLLKFAASSLYNSIDKNKDGKLDKKELKNVLSTLTKLHKRIKVKNKFKNGKS